MNNSTASLITSDTAPSPTYIAIDFETSAREANSACALGMSKIEQGVITETYYTLIRPPSSSILFTHIHGLTWDMLKTAPSFAEVWPHIATFIKGTSYFIAHNAPFDRRVLYASCKAISIALPKYPFLCTLRGARQTFPLSSRTLNSVCAYLGITLQHHNAASDAAAAAKIYLELRKKGIKDSSLRI